MEENKLLVLIKEVPTNLDIIKSVENDIERLDILIKDLQEQKKQRKVDYEELKEKLLAVFDALGVSSYNLGGNKITVRNNPASVEIENINDVSEEYIVKKVKYEVDKKKIRAYYQSTKVVPAGVKIANGRSITIKKEDDND